MNYELNKVKRIVDKYDRNDMSGLPRALFPGKIIVVSSEEEAESAVKFLLGQPLLGFDTETRPSFSKSRQYKVSLLQVCCGDLCFLFRLNRIDLPQCVMGLLKDNTITKIGLSWHDDLRLLNQRKTFQPGTFIDLQDVAGQMGIKDRSLQKLFANIFGQKIAKGQQLSNWESDNLSEAQRLYAATDAWACIQLYKEMTRMQEEGFFLIHNS